MPEELTVFLKPEATSWYQDWMPLFTLLVGGFIGFISSFLSQKAALKHAEEMLDKRIEQENKTRFHKEKMDLYSLYMSSVNTVHACIAVSGLYPEGDRAKSFDDFMHTFANVRIIGGDEVVNAASELYMHTTTFKTSYAEDTAGLTEDQKTEYIRTKTERYKVLRDAFYLASQRELGISVQ